MAAEEHGGPGGGPENRNEVPQSSAPRTPPEKDHSFAHVAWIVLAILVFGMILSTAAGDCSAACVSYP
ncbi:hypothetical protein ACFUJ0_00395 [Streptomyces sp. NPDC057242]|uniref:hypothetical protein n=1 Tax=unclassified Streptomyces TaxID=2593676 RepID=UPI00363E5932